MIRKNSSGIYQSSLLNELGVVHGYSHRNLNKEKFFEALGINPTDVVMGEQVHGIRVAVVGEDEKGKIHKGVDGLVSKDVAVGVTFADCVPIFAIDPKAKIIGAAHAGWKGTLAGIAREFIAQMKKAGAQEENIFISIGPHIGMCCYNVPTGRALLFQKKFGINEKIAARIEGEWHLDIGYANYQQLMDAGVQKEHIDAPPTCTSCQVREFHSFRKDAKSEFAVERGVIAL